MKAYAWLIAVGLGALCFATFVRAQTAVLLTGQAGVAGARGATGPTGPVGQATVGLEAGCGANGLEIDGGTGGQRVACSGSTSRLLRLLGPQSASNNDGNRVVETDPGGAVVYVTATGPSTALYLEDNPGKALGANGVVDLSAARLGLPFRRVHAYQPSCTSGCAPTLSCQSNERVLGGSCFATVSGVSLTRVTSVVFKERCYADASGCVDPAVTTPTHFRCSTDAAPGVDVHVEVVCWAE